MNDMSEYTSKLKQNRLAIRRDLNNLITEYEGTPASNGYIDIIIVREKFEPFIGELTKLGLAIESISWWCNATDENKKQFGCPHGYGGPMTKFGWFSELSHDFDEIDTKEIEHLERNCTNENIKRINNISTAIIMNKRTITYADGSYLVFEKNPCLTPGFWIRVPDDWRNQENV